MKLREVPDPHSVSMPPGHKLYRLTEDEAYIFYSSYCPPNDGSYVPGAHPLKDQLLLQRTNQAWAELGKKMGFEWETVQQHPSGSVLLFWAKPVEEEETPDAQT